MITPGHHALFDEVLTRESPVILTSHINPDGDSVGSEIGLAGYLIAGGAEVRIINQDPTPATLRFLEVEGRRVEVFDRTRHSDAFATAQRIVLLDNSAPDRLGSIEPIILAHAERVLCIDHHPTKGTPWAWNILVDEACATAEIVYELVSHRRFPIDRASAEGLYAGLSTDTGVFRFNSTTPRSHEIAADLLRLGVEPARSYEEIYERNSPAFTRLAGLALADLQLAAGGAVASVRITRAMIEVCGAEGLDTAEITTSLLAMDGVRVALLFRELDGGRVKVSLRSKGGLDVHRLAGEFGGGGHRNASGIVMEGVLDRVAAQVVTSAVAQVEASSRT